MTNHGAQANRFLSLLTLPGADGGGGGATRRLSLPLCRCSVHNPSHLRDTRKRKMPGVGGRALSWSVMKLLS